MKSIDISALFQWIWRRKIYWVMLLFIFLIHAFFAPPKGGEEQTHEFSKVYQQFNETIKEELKNPRKIVLLGGLTLLGLGALGVGSVLFFTWGLGFIRHARADHLPAPWRFWDLFRVVILSFFWGEFGFLIVLAGCRRLGVGVKDINEHFLMLSGTLWMDLLIFFFILSIVIGQAGGTCLHLGLTCRRFFRNVATGILGYVSALPILLMTLLTALAVVQILKYEPPPQPIQEIFFMEKGGTLLIASILAALVGPFFEELFFRGFLYNTLKKRVSPMTALWTTSAFFAGVHGNLFGFFPIMVLSALLTLLYEKTGSLVASITVHVLHNSLMIGFLFLAKELGGL